MSDDFEQWCRDRMTLSIDDLFDRYENIIEFYELMALRRDEQARDDNRDWRERNALKQEMIRDGFRLLKQMMPPIVNEILKKPATPDVEVGSDTSSKVAESYESRLLVSVLDSLTATQAEKLFGTGGTGGIFTPLQVMIILGVAQCDQPASALDDLFDGPNKVTTEQAMALQAAVTPDQWMPLMAFVMEKAQTLSKRWQPREYTAEVTVPAGGVDQLVFGVEVSIPSTEVFGLPETAEKITGIERDFEMQALVIEEEDAPHFNVVGVYLGAVGLWRAGLEIAAQRFTTSSVPSVRFNKRTTAGYMIVARVSNKTDVERRIRAKIVGRERT